MKNKKIIKEISYGIVPIFISENGKREFLLIQNHSGAWLFPKGHSENNEKEIDTAKRELFEETGLKCEKTYKEKFFIENHIFYRNDFKIYKTSKYYIGIVKDKKVLIQKEEVKDFYWGNEEYILKKINFENIKELFKEVVSYIDQIL